MYQVLCKMEDGTIAYLLHRNRTVWTLRTARKHIKDVTIKKINDSSYPVKYATLEKV